MGLFDKIVGAKASFGKNYAKPGRYWAIVDFVKLTTHQTKGLEQLIYETKILYVIDDAEIDVPAGTEPAHGKNARGLGPKAGEPLSFVFLDGILGNEARAKAFVMISMSVPEAAVTKDVLQELVDPTKQPLQSVVLDIYSTPQTTRANKKIIGSQAVRRVRALEVEQLKNDGALDEAALQILGNGRLDKMLAIEAKEFGNATPAAVGAAR